MAGAALPLWAPLGLAALVAYLFASPAHAGRLLPRPPNALPWAVAGGALLSPWPLRGAASLALLVAALWLLARVQRSVRVGDRTPFLSGAVAATVVQAVVAGGQLVVGHGGRAAGLTFHPNMAGAVATLVLFLALGAILGGERRERAWGVAGGTAALALLLASGSRGAFIAALAGSVAVLCAAAASRSRRTAVGALTVLLLLVSVGVVALVAPSAVRLGAAEESSALGGRPVLWGVGLTIASERPLLGYGADPWPLRAREVEPALRSTDIATVHNGFLYVLLLGGAIGLSAVLVWAARVGGFLMARSRAGLAAAGAALGLWLAFLTNNVSETLLPRTGLTLWVWCALLVLVASGRSAHEHQARDP